MVDWLNAIVDALLYYQIRDVKKSIYNVNDHRSQLTSLARTTFWDVIEKMTLTQANENRDEINTKVETVLDKETDSYGVEVLRVEIQKIPPPKDVQEAMNKVVKAEQEKTAAQDLETAFETKADGEAKAIKLVNEAADKYFKGNAQILKKLETVEKSLRNNSKIVVSSDSELVNVVRNLSGVVPVEKK
ncbi:SPFH/Band 7/PHB domain protein [Candidatus Woesearchaeota archaeon]|nr:SPFH/Band 7/PHB domain protein [Candidatus Woesearchaeota archaeon]